MKNTAPKASAFGAVYYIPKKLNHDDIHFLKFVFERVGEIVIRDEHVDVRYLRKGVGLDMPDF